MSNRIQNVVNEILRQNQITFKATYIEHIKKDAWYCDYFVITFKKHSGAIAFDYCMGLGHRKNNQVVSPKSADVLSNLLIDCVNGENFADWCHNFGYDNESPKALKAYELCLENEIKLKTLFNHEVFTMLQLELQDY